MNSNLKKWLFALLLSSPIFFIYAIHFFYHDAGHKPTGMIQWEHAFYMISAKEYQTGHATILYHYPLDDNPQSPKIFFQSQTIILGYLWKWLAIEPGVLLALFGLLFTILTLRIVVEIIDTILPFEKNKKLITLLFTWGGGILSFCGVLLHFFYFKTGTLADHIFYLDFGDGWWCLNFGRSLIFPLEAYYHFLFVLGILFVLKKKFLPVALVMVTLSLSHPYTATEFIAIVTTWAVLEYYYFQSKEINTKGLLLIGAAVLFHGIYYGLLMSHFEVARTISKQVALDWAYKAWHFVPAYFFVWLLSFLAVKNVALFKAQFSSPVNRLFFCWGAVAFLLSVHGFAIKPVQPIHYTRGYVYAGFFLFSIPAIIYLLNYVQNKKGIWKPILILAVFIFLADNISWFYFATDYNQTGIYLDKSQQQLINFFKQQGNGIAIGTDNTEGIAINIQLYSNYKAWVPHPFLTFNMDSKENAVHDLINKETIDNRWKNIPTYFFVEKNDTILAGHTFHFPVKFENDSFKVFQIN